LGQVRIVPSLQDSELTRTWAAGDVLLIDLLSDGDPMQSLKGLELEIQSGDEDLAIVGVEPALGWEMPFSQPKMGRDGAGWVAVLQSTRGRGEEGQVVPDSSGRFLLATVELEVKRSGRLNEILKVTATSVDIDGKLLDTVVFDAASSVQHPKSRRSSNVLQLVSGEPITVGYPVGATNAENLADARPWVAADASASIEIRDARSGDVASRLVAGRRYEVHYDAGSNGVSGYVAYTVADSRDAMLAVVLPADRGPWANTGQMSVSLHDDASPSIAVSDYPAGFQRYDTILDMQIPKKDTSGTPGLQAESTGHLFDFIPVGAAPSLLT
jgi:hypothetical protein